jgi:hypothetical protein
MSTIQAQYRRETKRLGVLTGLRPSPPFHNHQPNVSWLPASHQEAVRCFHGVVTQRARWAMSPFPLCKSFKCPNPVLKNKLCKNFAFWRSPGLPK